jgi:hypothetical protein
MSAHKDSAATEWAPRARFTRQPQPRGTRAAPVETPGIVSNAGTAGIASNAGTAGNDSNAGSAGIDSNAGSAGKESNPWQAHQHPR